MSSKIPVKPYVVQIVIKLVSSLKGGTSFKIIPLHVQTFTIHVPMTIVVKSTYGR